MNLWHGTYDVKCHMQVKLYVSIPVDILKPFILDHQVQLLHLMISDLEIASIDF